MNLDSITKNLSGKTNVIPKKQKISTTQELLKEIHKQLQNTGEVNELPNDYQKKLGSYVLGRDANECHSSISEVLSKRDFYLNDKELSFYDSQGDNYFIILNLFRAVVFTKCDFKVEDLPFKTEVRFDRCAFLKGLSFNPTSFKSIENHIVFHNCNFFKKVELISYEQQHDLRSKKPSFEVTLFEQCSFFQELSAKHLHFNSPMFFDEKYGSNEACSEEDDEYSQDFLIKKLIIHDCFFDEGAGLYLNHYTIDSVSILRTHFKAKFEFKGNLVSDCCIDDCNFEKVSDFFKSKFDVFQMRKTVFSGFAAFEDTEFGISKGGENNIVVTQRWYQAFLLWRNTAETAMFSPAIFKYVTFKDFSNFRTAKFHHGLDIEKSNFTQSPNFLSSKVPLQGSTRETFRIIKHSFDDVGNFIEANKFFSFEMEKYHEDLQKKLKKPSELPKEELKKGKSDLVIFKLNQLFSGFGQNWIRPAYLILLLAIISQFVYCDFDDINLNDSFFGLNFCEYAVNIKDFLCEQSAAWLIMPILILLIWWRYCCFIGATVIGLFSLAVLLEILNESFTISELVVPSLDFLNNIAKNIPPFNKLLVTGHEFASFVFNILFAILIWQTIVAVKRLTRR